MSDEHSAQDAATDVETTEVAEESAVEDAPSYDWNGELEALTDNEFFNKIEDDDIKGFIRSGVEAFRKNADRLLHKKSMQLSAATKTTQTTMEEVAELRDRLKEAAESLGQDNADVSKQVEALKASYESELEDFKGKFEESERTVAQLAEERTALTNAIEQFKGKLEHQRDVYQNKVDEYIAQVDKEVNGLKAELEKYKTQAETYEKEQQEREYTLAVKQFKSEFPHIKEDEQFKSAISEYYTLLEGLCAAAEARGTEVTNEVHDRYAATAKRQILEMYPVTNPDPAKTPEAESLASPPRAQGAGSSGISLDFGPETTTVF